MNSSELYALLESLNACPDAVEWAQGKDLQTFWDTCPRAGWMLWLVRRMVGQKGWTSHQTVVLAACDCAETTLKYVPPGENRPRKCIETVRAWVEGKASLDAVREARRASADAASDADVYADATYAAAATAYAAYAAVCSSSNSVYAAASSAVYAADAGVPQERLLEIVRKRIPVPYKEESK